MLGLLAGENQGLDIPLHDVAAAALESNKENLRTTGRSSKAKGATQNRGISLRNDNKTDDEKPFKCQFPGCNKRFALAGYLKQHQICHSDARPFKCSHCDAKFARRYQLRVHERAKHTNERPYKCTHPGCNKTFTTASSALDHVRRCARDVYVFLRGREPWQSTPVLSLSLSLSHIISYVSTNCVLTTD